jgi:hypothetical protein
MVPTKIKNLVFLDFGKGDNKKPHVLNAFALQTD